MLIPVILNILFISYCYLHVVDSVKFISGHRSFASTCYLKHTHLFLGNYYSPR